MECMTQPDSQSPWSRLFAIVRDRFPYCKMREVHVANGTVVAYGGVEYTVVMNSDPAGARSPLPEGFDAHWNRSGLESDSGEAILLPPVF